MKPARTGYTTSTIERLESISMNELDREIARTALRSAELFAGILVAAGSAIGAVLRMRPRAMKHSRLPRPGAPV
jgi:hypothetical protein